MAAPSADLLRQLPLVRLEYRDVVGSTMDEAHRLAQAGAPAGTLVLAGRQETGRGRAGRGWQSPEDAGFWGTFIERPADRDMLAVLSLRVGLRVAGALDPLADDPVQLKWPNDLYLAAGKLGGILIEARWRDGQPEWVAIGIGINRLKPDRLSPSTGGSGEALEVPAAGLREGVSSEALVAAVVPAVRSAAAVGGLLTEAECAAWSSRDLARGRAVVLPGSGVVEGIAPDGALRIRGGDGLVRSMHSGSLRFIEAP